MSLPPHLLAPAGWPEALPLRLAVAADEADLQRVLYPDRPVASFGQHFKHSLAQQAKARSFWLVAGDAAGICAGMQLLRGATALEIANLAVRADRRGQGLGTRLIGVAGLVARHYFDQPMLEINVATDNQRARALYERLGFRQQRLFYVPDGTWAVRLARAAVVETDRDRDKI